MEMLLVPKPPIGLAFEIADLILLQGWAEFHNVRVVVELDNCVQDDVYEEVVRSMTRTARSGAGTSGAQPEGSSCSR